MGCAAVRTTRGFSGKALFVVCAWGVSFVATRMALETLTPVALVATRTIIGSAVLVAIARFRGTRVLPPREALAPCLILGVIVAVHLLIQTSGLAYTSAINTAWIIGFIPVCIAIGARIFLQHRLEGIGWLGVAVATGGVLLLTMQEMPNFAHARLGDLLVLASCVTWTAYTLLSVKPVARHGALSMTVVPMMIAAVVLAGACVIGGRILCGVPTLQSVSAIVFLSIICSGVAYLLWFSAVREHGPARTGAYIYLEPFVTLVVAWVTLGEPITPRTMVGGCFVLLGVHFVTRGSRH